MQGGTNLKYMFLFILSAAFMICMGMAGALLGFFLMQRRQKEQEREQAVIDGYPWDWTREQEQQVEAAMELICDKCHEPHRCSQDELDEECALCPIRDALYMMAAGKEARG